MKTLKIEDLSKNFGTTEVLKKINLDIDEGNFLVLLGPSGCCLLYTSDAADE